MIVYCLETTNLHGLYMTVNLVHLLEFTMLSRQNFSIHNSVILCTTGFCPVLLTKCLTSMHVCQQNNSTCVDRVINLKSSLRNTYGELRLAIENQVGGPKIDLNASLKIKIEDWNSKFEFESQVWGLKIEFKFWGMKPSTEQFRATVHAGSYGKDVFAYGWWKITIRVPLPGYEW